MTTILFDLDGTLLNVDKEKFIKTYFNDVCNYFSDICAHKVLMNVLIKGTEAMVADQSGNSNQKAFVNCMEEIVGDPRPYMDKFDEYYQNEFSSLGHLVKPMEKMQKCIQLLIDKGYNVGIATNPMFPETAVIKRIEWSGLAASNFIYYPTYERHTSTKPHAKFYQEIANELGIDASDCLMVGNDMKDDMVASTIGMKTFFLTDQGTNHQVKHHVDYSGNTDAFYEFVQKLPKNS